MTNADDYIAQVVNQMPYGTPLRAQIALELRGHIAERRAHGQSLHDIMAQLGEPSTLAESYLAAVPLVSAGFWLRVVAKVVDWIASFLAVAVLLVPVAWTVSRSGEEQFLMFLFLPLVLFGSLLFLVHTVVAEWQWGQTLGKRLFGLRAVRESGARISLGQAFVRHLPMLLQVFWIDVLFALFTDRHQRAFELLSKTRVVVVGPR